MKLTLLSLGAGVQSTTLALMTVEGLLPRIDGAVFADTGWEPRRVYEHLDRLRDVLTAADIPLYVCRTLAPGTRCWTWACPAPIASDGFAPAAGRRSKNRPVLGVHFTGTGSGGPCATTTPTNGPMRSHSTRPSARAVPASCR